MLNQALYAASLVTFTFGAVMFSVLVVLYWRGKRRSPVLAAFTLALAASFVINLAMQVVDWPALPVALSVVTALLPALIFHLEYAQEARDLPFAPLWKWMVMALYVVSLTLGWNRPASVLSAGAGMALAARLLSRRKLDRRGQHYRMWTAAILSALVFTSAVQLSDPAPLFSLLPDYLVLALFSITLYYRERLIFFDVVIKRGAMFLVALTGLTMFATFGFRFLDNSQIDWTRVWIGALALTPFWMAAPWIYRGVENFADRAWLGRRYAAEEAEQKFAREIQGAGTEAELRERAAASLADIFRSHAEISCSEGSDSGDGISAGSLHVAERVSGAPFLSDDHRLLRSLARTFDVVLDNVRFRAREEQLRLLASRAELKALRAQINPHFLFNALNAIAGLIASDPALADETIERLARVFRYALTRSETEWVRLDEELAFVQAYLQIEQARFGRRLRVEMEIDPAARAVQVPAVSVQPLVENAIKHGVSVKEGPGVVAVRAKTAEGRLRLEVFDSGPGFPAGFAIGEGGRGLRNIADRLAGYYGASARLWWQNETNGSSVFFEIPLNGDARSDRG